MLVPLELIIIKQIRTTHNFKLIASHPTLRSITKYNVSHAYITLNSQTNTADKRGAHIKMIWHASRRFIKFH